MTFREISRLNRTSLTLLDIATTINVLTLGAVYVVIYLVISCPPVRGDSEWIILHVRTYATYNSVELAHYNIARTKVGKGGINLDTENANFIL